MGVTISIRGRQADPALRAEALAWARTFSREMEWAARPVRFSAPRGFLGREVLETPGIQGLSLLPHFACEPVPLLFLETTGQLLDHYVEDEGGQDVQLQNLALVKTHFGGPEVHAEVCHFLSGLRRDFIPDLEVDDETGYFATADIGALQNSFDAAWRTVLEHVPEGGAELGESFVVGGFEFFSGDTDTSTAGPEHQKLLEELQQWLNVRYGGFGLAFAPSPDGVDNLDLLMHEVNEEGWLDDLESDEAEGIAQGIGASFGSAVRELLGGRWQVSAEGGLVLTGVGGVGMRVDPFQVAADRIAEGPAHGFAHHLQAYQELVRRVSGRVG